MSTSRTSPLSSLPAARPGWRAWLSHRHPVDWLYAAGLAVGALVALWRQGAAMDGYESAILLGTVPALVALAWHWRPLQALTAVAGLLALSAIALYQGDLARGEQVAWLRLALSSQSAILWMALLFGLSTVCYWLALFMRGGAAQSTAVSLAWGGVLMALTGTLVRWYESHLLGPDIGHIPVSNLYEVFVLFAWVTTLMQLYYGVRHNAVRALGAFVMLIVCAAVAFLLWYAVARQAYEIQPLVPALDSWWMKLHVPANFVGYGTFALAAMVALAYLLSQRWPASALARALPPPSVLDDVMYKAISLGFAFFTVATILGALWAAEAWGGYWSWDPKETWALIVWLNYAAWLHMRLVKGLRGTFAAWWALVGLAVTTFAFIGVNLFLSGLHSYGEL